METLMLNLESIGHNVILLTTCEKGELHKFLEKNNLLTYANPIIKGGALVYFIRQLWFLITFCWKYRIDVIHSHLQDASVVAVVAQYFIRAKVYIFRHHFEFYQAIQGINIARNRNEALGEQIINQLARKIIVPSSGVYDGMRNHEKVDMGKVDIVPYLYDFSKYSRPNPMHIAEIKDKYPCCLRLLMCARLIPAKRHRIVFEKVNKLVGHGLNVKLLVLDEGPEKERLNQFIQQYRLEDHIFMLGFRTDFVNYMAASDLLIHPSLIEASNSAVKEMGMLEKAVAVCENIGDFSDYIIHKKNGYLMSIDNTSEDIENIIVEVYRNPEILSQLGKQLRQDILTKFSVSSNVLSKYQMLV